MNVIACLLKIDHFQLRVLSAVLFSRTQFIFLLNFTQLWKTKQKNEIKRSIKVLTTNYFIIYFYESTSSSQNFLKILCVSTSCEKTGFARGIFSELIANFSDIFLPQ